MNNGFAMQRRLLLVDGPAHGTNAPPVRRFALADCVGVAADILDHFDVDEPVDWLGNAWRRRGIQFAHSHPTRIRSLIAVGAPIHALGPADRRRTQLLAVLYRIVGARTLAAMLTDVLVGPDARRSTRRAPRSWPTPSGGHRRAIHAAIASLSLSRPDLAPMLKAIATPVLITAGHNDPMWSVAKPRRRHKICRTRPRSYCPARATSDRCYRHRRH